jgi:hypothetical protein
MLKDILAHHQNGSGSPWVTALSGDLKPKLEIGAL